MKTNRHRPRQRHRDDRRQTETDELIGDQPREQPLDHVEPRRARVRGAGERLPDVGHRAEPRNRHREDLVEPEGAIRRLHQTRDGDVGEEHHDHQPGVPRQVRVRTFEDFGPGHRYPAVKPRVDMGAGEV